MACRVDFYVQATGAPQGHLTLACRVTEKAYQAGHRIYVRCQDKDQASKMDELLWTFSQSSFVPHQLSSSGQSEAPVAGSWRPRRGRCHLPRGSEDAIVSLLPLRIGLLDRKERQRQ